MGGGRRPPPEADPRPSVDARAYRAFGKLCGCVTWSRGASDKPSGTALSATETHAHRRQEREHWGCRHSLG